MMHKLSLPVVKKNSLQAMPADRITIITGALVCTTNKTLLAWAKKQAINKVRLCLEDGDSMSVTPLDPTLAMSAMRIPFHWCC